MIKFIKNITIIIFLSCLQLSAQNFTASVSNKIVGLNSRFQLTFTFQGKNINSTRAFSPPSLRNFFILSGPNQSTSVQIINGRVSGSLSYSYYLQPKKLGKYTIGVASVGYHGQTLRSNPIKIEVVKGSSRKNNNRSGNNTVSNKDIAKNLFVRTIVNKRRVFLGEQVTVTYKLYTRVNIADQMSISKLPQYSGFWAEELKTSNNLKFTTEVIKGERFKVAVLKKVALFPNQTGKLSITPFGLIVPIRITSKRRTGNIFDDFFDDPFSRSKTINYDAKSNTVKINVLPLPQKNVPASFDGAVGNYSLKATLDKTKLKTNEITSFKVSVNGQGNIKLLNLPKLVLPNGFDKYEPKVKENINRINKIYGTKTEEYIIVPRAPGKKILKPVEFSFFNPSKKKYITLHSPIFKLDVLPGNDNVVATLKGLSKEDIKLLGVDIRFIKTKVNDISQIEGILLYKSTFWIMSGVPLFILFVFVGLKRRQDKLAGDVSSLKFSKAQKISKSRLKKAKKLLKSNNEADFYSEISQTLFGYLEDKLHLTKSEFSLEKAEQILRAQGIKEELIDNLKDCVEKCEFIRFAPEKGGSEGMNEMYKNSTEVIVEIERNITQKIKR